MVILLGMTATGKTAIKEELLKLGFENVVTTTTRPMRDGEVDGFTYNFVSDSTFQKMKDDNEFIETTMYDVANGETWFYGTTKNSLQENSVVICNMSGVTELLKLTEFRPVVYLIKTNDETIIKRATERGDDVAEIMRRLKADKKDFEGADELATFIMRNNENTSIKSLAKLIKMSHNTVTAKRIKRRTKRGK